MQQIYVNIFLLKILLLMHNIIYITTETLYVNLLKITGTQGFRSSRFSIVSSTLYL